MVIEGAFEVEDSRAIEVELVKWVELEEPFPWVDWLVPWGTVLIPIGGLGSCASPL